MTQVKCPRYCRAVRDPRLSALTDTADRTCSQNREIWPQTKRYRRSERYLHGRPGPA